MTFVPIEYLIDQGAKPPLLVKGFAFETPGWPEWHACVRYGNRLNALDGLFDDWIVDHFDTGFALSVVGRLRSKSGAPEAMARVLNEKGQEKVHKRLAELGFTLP